MALQRLGKLCPCRHHGIEREHRLLEDDRNAAAPHLAHIPFRDLQQIATLELDRAAHDGAGIGQQPHHRKRRHRFAAAGFPHQGKRFAVANVESNAVHGAHDGRSRVDPRSKIPDPQQGGVFAHFNYQTREW